MRKAVFFEIPFQAPTADGQPVGWTLVISRDVVAERVTFALHFGDKPEPTHVTTEEMSDVQEMFEELTKDG